jgi:hypothetical protein
MRILSRGISLAGLPLLFVTLAAAQGSFDAYVGAAAITDKSNGQMIDTFGTGNFVAAPKLSGATLNMGASVFVTPHFGVGGEVSLRPGKSDYAGLSYRPLFFDINALWKPTLRQKRVVPELQAGLGGVNLRFYLPPSCDIVLGCNSANTYLASSNHLQVHFGAGVRFYVTNSIFVRPEFDMHWVHNFFQFGSDFVPQYGAVVGYTFGGR